MEVVFRVEEPKALFNYALSSDGCQVELRLADNLRMQPEEIALSSIRESDVERGMYHATLVDRAVTDVYNVAVHIAIKLDSGELILSNPIRITTTNYVGGIVAVTLPKSGNAELKRDVVFSYDVETQTFNAYIDHYTSHRTYFAQFVTDGVDCLEIDGVVVDKEGATVDFSRDVQVDAFLADKIVHLFRPFLRLSGSVASGGAVAVK